MFLRGIVAMAVLAVGVGAQPAASSADSKTQGNSSQAAPKQTPATSAQTKSAVKGTVASPAASTKTTTAKTTATKTAASKAPASKTAAVKTSAASKNVSSKTGASKTVTRAAAPPVRRYVQQQPTTDRYREIQQALSDRGYFRGSVDGTWGPESVDALKQFQREQKIDDDGKINSLSLIALGLGPRRTVAASAPALPQSSPSEVSAPVEAPATAPGP